ncbi:hypothetical protein SFRURICE_006236 [Spodoptera frugiperda]|nr:hypothetical protein SFRURICE_006236 [Spodoptera frugiperda]
MFVNAPTTQEKILVWGNVLKKKKKKSYPFLAARPEPNSRVRRVAFRTPKRIRSPRMGPSRADARSLAANYLTGYYQSSGSRSRTTSLDEASPGLVHGVSSLELDSSLVNTLAWDEEDA